MAAREASAEGIHWTFAPMIDITRDPRWGRVSETVGEDPYLASVLGVAMVRGFQGASIAAPDALAACAKHYVGYGATEAGKDYNSTWIPEILLREVYLRPFHAVAQAGIATFMTSFNALNGVPASGNQFTLRSILRDEWKFPGLIVSDYESVTEMVKHGYAEDAADAAEKALRAGVDMEMVSTSYFDHGKALLDSRRVDLPTVDEAVRDVLRLKFKLGLFDGRSQPAETVNVTSESLAIEQRLATESAVLLKNDRAVLPLSISVKTIAVIGPLADSPVDQMGTWVMDARNKDVQTPLQALRKQFSASRVLYEKTLTNSRDSSHDRFAAALTAARAADAVVLFLGEEQILSGEAHARAFLNLPGAQEALVDEMSKAGKPVIAVIQAGRPLTFHSVTQKVNALLYLFHAGTMAGPAIADLLSGRSVPSGKLTITFPRTVGQIPIYYAHLNTGRPPSPGDLGVPMGDPVDPVGYTSKYLDVDFTPEYPFGFGLSYTTFEYSAPSVSVKVLHAGGKLRVSAEVKNTGSVESEEIVQLYTRDLVGSVSRPVRELKGFRRVRLKPGESRRVEFTITPDDLAFYNQSMKLVTEPGQFHVWISPDSARGTKAEFRFE